MNVDLPNILKSIGPAASIIFAAWIFMGFLQQRYDGAISRYREMIEKYRSSDSLSDERRSNLKDQVLIYRQHCDLMSRANLAGLVAAILLILTLVAGELDIMFPDAKPLAYLGAGAALLGFVLVIVAAGIVIREGQITRQQIDDELLEVEDLANAAGLRPGAAADGKRPGKAAEDRHGLSSRPEVRARLS